jgi:hypothetical protein
LVNKLIPPFCGVNVNGDLAKVNQVQRDLGVGGVGANTKEIYFWRCFER